MSDVEILLQNMKRYLDQARVLAAKAEYDKVIAVLENSLTNSLILAQLEQYQECIDCLMEKYTQLDNALHSTEGEGGDWKFGAEHLGMTTSYKIEENGSVSICICG